MLPTREKVLSFEFTPSNEELGKMYAWLLLERTTIACADSSLATCDVDAMTLSLTRRMNVCESDAKRFLILLLPPRSNSTSPFADILIRMYQASNSNLAVARRNFRLCDNANHKC